MHDERSHPLPAAVDQAAFRIVQESLTNVVRHTEQAAAVVTLRTANDVLSIVVADNGPSPTALTEGGGIAGMRDRARAVGGHLAVTSDGHGVSVRAELPVGTAEDQS